MSALRGWLDRVMVQAVTDGRSGAERNEELMRHLAQVDDQNHCLAAVRELLARHLVLNIATAGSLHQDDTTKLRACERMEFARMFLLELEQERANAKAWLQEQKQ